MFQQPLQQLHRFSIKTIINAPYIFDLGKHLDYASFRWPNIQ